MDHPSYITKIVKRLPENFGNILTNFDVNFEGIHWKFMNFERNVKNFSWKLFEYFEETYAFKYDDFQKIVGG